MKELLTSLLKIYYLPKPGRSRKFLCLLHKEKLQISEKTFLFLVFDTKIEVYMFACHLCFIKVYEYTVLPSHHFTMIFNSLLEQAPTTT